MDSSIEVERQNNAKLHFNYLMIVAIICEFCNKWCFAVFDTIVPIYGEGDIALDSFTFSMMSVVGSLVNIFQTGWLYNFLIRINVSIPIITSFAGVFYCWVYIDCVNDSCFLHFVYVQE